jgi:hypothetical protein
MAAKKRRRHKTERRFDRGMFGRGMGKSTQRSTKGGRHLANLRTLSSTSLWRRGR